MSVLVHVVVRVHVGPQLVTPPPAAHLGASSGLTGSGPPAPSLPHLRYTLCTDTEIISQVLHRFFISRW